MKIQNISSSNSFKGMVSIAEDLTPNLQKNISKALFDVKLEKKPYDLFISKSKDKDFLAIQACDTAAKQNSYTVKVHRLSQKTEILKDALQTAMNTYEARFMQQ